MSPSVAPPAPRPLRGRRAGALALGAAVALLWCPPLAAQPLRVQLSWTHQAQYAGYYVAEARGYYEREAVQVSLVEGGPNVWAVERLALGQADLVVTWLSHALGARRRGADLVNVAQVFQRAGVALACRKSEGIRSPSDLRGRSVGVWNLGDEASVRAWLRRHGVGSVKLVPQAPDGIDLLERRVPCATVMVYNELWTLLEAGVDPSDLYVVRFDEEALDIAEDGIYARRAALEDAAFRQRVARFLRATAAGWREARAVPEEALRITLGTRSQLDRAQQKRMLDAVLPLVPATVPFGLLTVAHYDRAVDLLAADAADPLAFRRVAERGWTHQLWYEADIAPPAPLRVATRHYLGQAVTSRWFYLLDLVGTAAFGVAGFLRARQRRYDLWGAFVLTFLPAAGGGTVRDLLVGGDRSPPGVLRDPAYLTIVIAVLVAGTVLSRVAPASVTETRGFFWALAIFDTVGLSTFTVVGAEIALTQGLPWYWAAICAAVTAAGGGMLVDVVSGREPRTFQGEPYEEIAVAGAIFMYLLLRAADTYEHAVWSATGAIAATLALTFAARVAVVARGFRSYRL